jgi:phage-related protein (TIGR01555 family)
MTKPTSSMGRLREIVRAGETSVGAFKARFDGWFNLLTGLGTSRDKSVAAEFEPEPPLDPQSLENLFHYNDLAATLVTAVVEDGLRQGFDLSHESEGADGPDVSDAQDAAKTLAKKLEELGVLLKLAEGWTWGRLFGRGAILLGVEGGGPPETLLDDTKVTGIRFLTVLDKRDLMPDSYYGDPLAPKYGQVQTYLLQPTSLGNVPATAYNLKVHETRLVMFGGATTSRRERERNQQCDHSVLQKAHNILRDCNQNWDSVRAMLADMSQAVFKIAGLIDAIAEGDQKTITTRVALMDTLRSITRAVVLDTEGEEFEIKERGAMSGLADILDRTWIRLAAAFRMPVTRMMGQAPAGLNATGAEDRRSWYDTVEAERTLKAKPGLERIVRIVARVEVPTLEPSGWTVSFPSLWSMSPTEQADYEGKMTTADGMRIDKGIALPEEITLSRARKNGYRLPLVLDLKARKKALELELEDMTNPPPPPPALPAPGGPPAAPGAPPSPPRPAPAPGGPPAPPA